jgi:glycosyltransferase involved in cell wall biosynthesis
MDISFIYYHFSSFVRQDYEILSKHFQVEKVNYRKLQDVMTIARSIWRSDVSFSWFASGHSLIAVLLSIMLSKKSVVIAGGYDVAFVPEINYGQYTQGWKKRKYTDFALENADLVLAVSEFTKTEVLARAKPKRIEVIYNAIDVNWFRPGDENEGRRRENVILTVASGLKGVIQLKGLQTFVEAAAYLPKAKFVVLGLPRDEINALNSIRSSNNVELLGHMNQDGLIAYYQKAKVYCQLSYRESFGVALAEAMACGCVPVVTERGALPEVVGTTGYIVSFGDSEATAKAIEKALSSDKGKEARERIERIFSLQRREEKLVLLLESLIGGR